MLFGGTKICQPRAVSSGYDEHSNVRKSSIKVHLYHIFGLNVARKWQNKLCSNLNCDNFTCFDFKSNFTLLWLPMATDTLHKLVKSGIFVIMGMKLNY
jgi:hypothetical protein